MMFMKTALALSFAILSLAAPSPQGGGELTGVDDLLSGVSTYLLEPMPTQCKLN
jgi:hypothetical protein